MSDEIKLSISLTYAKGGIAVDTSDMGLTALLFTVSGTDYVKSTQVIGTASSEAIGKGEITTPGWLVVKNTDATNYVEIERATFTSTNGTVKLKAGEVAVFRIGSTAPHALANTGNCIIHYLMLED